MAIRQTGIEGRTEVNTLAGAERRRTRLNCWNTTPIPPRALRSEAPATPPNRTPSMRMEPESGSVRPLMQRNSVDFPEPLGPGTATNSPADTSSEASRSASKSPGKPRYRQNRRHERRRRSQALSWSISVTITRMITRMVSTRSNSRRLTLFVSSCPIPPAPTTPSTVEDRTLKSHI